MKETSKYAKLANILNSSLDEMNKVVPAPGANNCGHIFIAAEYIRVAMSELAVLEKNESSEVTEDNDNHGDEVQPESRTD
jgi:hypothetical protein